MFRERLEKILRKINEANILTEGEFCDLSDIVEMGLDQLEELNLPEKLEISPEEMKDVDMLNEEEIIDFIPTYLSDRYGCCVFGFKWKFKNGFLDDPIIITDIDWDITD